MFKTLKAMKKYTVPYKRLYLSASIITALFALLAVVDPYLSGKVIDGIRVEDEPKKILTMIGIVIGVTILRTGLRYTYFVRFERFSQKVVYDLRKDLYKKLQSLDFNYFDKTPNGRIMSKMTGDVEAIRHFYAWVTHNMIFHSIVFTVAVVTMFILNPILASTLVLLIPFIGFFSFRLSKSARPMFKQIREQFSKLNTVVQENISGNRLIKALAREPYEIEKFQKENEAYREKSIELATVWEKNLPALDAMAAIFNVVVLFAGGYLIIKGRMTIGELVTYNRLLWMVNNPLRMSGWLIGAAQNFSASYDRVEELLNEESSILIPEKNNLKDKLHGYVRFENVSFNYDDLPVLTDISFEVKPGETIALLGSTGSGKSTLISLVSRFYDATEGKIFIDDEPISTYDIYTLRNNISVAMQDIFLFSDTIEENISYGVPKVSKKQVRVAAEIAGVNEFIHQFEDSFNTVVGERGVGLSGGQKQRIALARAIIEDPAILILDDTTSAVDMETEYKILTELKKINEQRTTFIIAHRISSVKDADQILVMDEGKIIERGNHSHLISKKGYYYDVFTQQMGEFDKDVKGGE